jgi:predicted ester cyclase
MFGECLTQVAQAYDDYRRLLVEAQLTPDLVHQIQDLVANTPGAITSEVRKIFAQLGGVYASEFGQAR